MDRLIYFTVTKFIGGGLSFYFKETPITKVITCMKIYGFFTCKIKNGISVKDIYTFGYIVVLAIYTSHTGQYIPKHTIVECSAVCLSVIIE